MKRFSDNDQAKERKQRVMQLQKKALEDQMTQNQLKKEQDSIKNKVEY